MNSQKKITAIQLLVLFIPLVLLLILTYPIENHLLVHWIIYGFSIAILGIVLCEKWTLRDLGIRTDNLRTTFLPYALFTITGLIGIFLFAFFLDQPAASNWWLHSHFQYGFLVASVLQEFMFRGFLMPKLRIIFDHAWQVIAVNAALFTLVHLIFPDALLFLPLGLVSGIAFAALYYYYPNLILISISHSILNFFALYFCFFSLSVQCS